MPTAPRTLLLVSRMPRNLQLLADFLQKEGYATLTAISYEEFDQALARQQEISGSLIDIAGFDAQIWTRCDQLFTGKIPYMIFSPKQSAAVQQASISHGARGVIAKPLVVKELIGIVHTILED